MDDLTTYAENTWCPGCSNFGIFNAFKDAVKELETRGISREKVIIAAGIGNHAKIFDYLKLSGFYSLHGRSMATAQGIKIANPDLKVVTFAGDGDAYGEGMAHMIFAAKRNIDITVIVHNNGVYALTTGQTTPVSKKGTRGPSTPHGSVESPLNPLALMLEAGATFIARGYPAKLDQLTEIMVSAVEHEGFSIVEVLQPCVSFNNTYALYNEATEVLKKTPKSYDEAMRVIKAEDKIPIGVLYQVTRPTYHRELYGDLNPAQERLSKENRRERISQLLRV
ncbi:MAG: thiamine pyrophosphate-dependent enzyme [Halobacteriota archaeon]|nr:thiamine pyrophosphate-dependent enzyme [Halobacteriota archaeon]MDY6932314.1 thiamine pyrophosphate-dependent enzyme [Halobacteriota archaeon]